MQFFRSFGNGIAAAPPVQTTQQFPLFASLTKSKCFADLSSLRRLHRTHDAANPSSSTGNDNFVHSVLSEFGVIERRE